MPLPAAAPGTHGMPPPLFGQPGVGGGGTGGGPPGGPDSIPRGGPPNGMLFFSGPPLPMLLLDVSQQRGRSPRRRRQGRAVRLPWQTKWL